MWANESARQRTEKEGKKNGFLFDVVWFWGLAFFVSMFVCVCVCVCVFSWVYACVRELPRKTTKDKRYCLVFGWSASVQKRFIQFTNRHESPFDDISLKSFQLIC